MSSPVALSRQLPLPRNIQTVVNGAWRKPIAYLPTLLSLFENEPSWATHPQLLPIFLHQFKRALPLCDHQTEDDRSCVEVARIALEGVCIATSTLAALTSNSTTGSSLDLSYILSAWPSIWKWAHYLYYEVDIGQVDTTFNAESRPTKAKLPIMTTMQRLFTHNFRDPSPALRSVVATSKGVLKMVMEIWIRQSDRYQYDVTTVDSLGISHALSDILALTDPDHTPELTGGGHGDHPLAPLLVKPLRSIVYEVGQQQLRSVHGYIAVYRMLFERTLLLFLDLIEHDLTDDIAYALHLLISVPPPVPRETQVCITKCFYMISMGTILRRGYTWVISVIRWKLIQSLLRHASSPFSGLDGENALCWLSIMGILEQNIIHRPLLKLLGSVVSSSTVISLSSKASYTGHPSFWIKWSGFLGKLGALQKIHAAFDTSEESKLKCSSPKCTNTETNKRFQVCEGCQLAVYCSQSCQRDHWKDWGHREECQLPGKVQPVFSVRISLRDRAWFSFLGDERMKTDYQRITRLRDKALSDHGVQPLILRIDYMTYPPQLSIFPAKHYNPYNPSNPTQYPKGELIYSEDKDKNQFRGIVGTTVVPLPMASEQAKRRPRIQPVLIAYYSAAQRGVVFIPSRVSGNLFGWIRESTEDRRAVTE